MSKHVVILGAGVIGLSTALYCVKRGMAVTVIERNGPARGGCSFGNAGMVVPSHFIPLAAPGMVKLGLKWMWNPESPFYIQPRFDMDLLAWALRFWRASNREQVRAAAPALRDLSLLSRQGYEELAAQGLDFGLVQKGLLMLCKTQHTLDEEGRAARMARELGIPAEVLDARQTAALDPGMTMDVCGSVYFPKDCHLSPARLMAALEAALRREGVQFLWNAEAKGFSTEPGRIRAVRTARGDEISADEFVLCGGVWTEATASALDLRLPMQAGKGYSLTLNAPRQMPALCSICTEARIAVTPMDGALRFGGTMEMSGINDTIMPRRVRGIIRSVPDYFPEFREADFAGIPPWHGLRPCSPDGMPYLGRTRRWGNVTLATGHAMMGLSLAPATGKVVAALLDGEPAPVKLEKFSPDRFA